MRVLDAMLMVALLAVAVGCEEPVSAGGESDDTSLIAAADDVTSESAPSSYTVTASEPIWVIPSGVVPAEVIVQPSNNNVDIVTHDDALYVAWRTGPTHFADAEVQMPVMRSDDGGTSWVLETVVDLDSDLREPRLVSFNGVLQLIFFEAGVFAFTFDPQHVWRTVRGADGGWSEPEILFEAPEVPWDIKVRRGAVWMTSYLGEHYGGEGAVMEVLFRRSEDGESWSMVEGASHVYRGGVSEAAIEFDRDGGLWVVTRNEDGDETGFGSHVCYAAPEALSVWECPEVSDPERYDSPELFRHEDDIYMVARRDVGGPYGPEGDILAYSDRPKRSALYRIDRDARAVIHMMDLPGAGDTAFGAIQQLDDHRFLLANYTSPLDEPDITWIEGQTSERGTQIYLLTLTFTPETP
jgi:hypothetical protein